MTRLFTIAAGLFCVLAAVAAACGGTAPTLSSGATGQTCYPNGTCNAGLTCLSNVCVVVPGDGGSSSGGSSGSGSGSSSGAGEAGSDAPNDATASDAHQVDASDAGPGPSDAGDGSDGFVCTTFSASEQPENCLNNTGSYSVPAYFALSTSTACDPQTPTPAACQCKETYTCSCLIADVVCPDGGAVGQCIDPQNMELTVFCN